ncbi:MAG: hypothetical protein ACPGEC_06155 [Flavobacteriales bacterium]
MNNIESQKLELMHLLLHTQQVSVLEKLKAVFQEQQQDWWDAMSEDEQAGIKAGLDDADKGNYVENKVVMKHFDKWL